MSRSLIVRPGDFLLAIHPDVFNWQPTYTRYSPNWWSFLWLWFEVSHAWDEDTTTHSAKEEGE